MTAPEAQAASALVLTRPALVADLRVWHAPTGVVGWPVWWANGCWITPSPPGARPPSGPWHGPVAPAALHPERPDGEGWREAQAVGAVLGAAIAAGAERRGPGWLPALLAAAMQTAALIEAVRLDGDRGGPHG